MDHEQLKISSVANLTSDSMGMALGEGGALKVLEKGVRIFFILVGGR